MGGGSSGGGGTTTQQSNQYSNISPWAQPYVSSILGAAQQQVFQTTPSTTDASGNVTPGTITGINPYQAYGMNGAGMSDAAQQAAQSSVAGFSPLQQQSFQGAANLQTPGQFGQATGAAGLGTLQALGAGQGLQNTLTNANAMSQYMNPYLQNTLAPAQQLLNQQYGIAGQQAAGQATTSGAFGGSRSALQQGLNAQNQMLAQNQLVGNAYNQAYQNAQTQANNVANLGLQGAQAGIQGGTALGNLGTAQLAAQQGVLGTQNQYGTQQQQQQQNIINQAMQNYATAQQYPMTQLTNLKSLLTGLPVTDVTTTQQQAAPSTTAAIASLGTGAIGAAGLYNAANKRAGGKIEVKKMAPGGIATVGGAIGGVSRSLDLMDDMELTNVVKTTSSPFIRKQAQELLNERQADAMAANSRGGAGVAAAPATNNMFTAAEGGIVSFVNGGTADTSSDGLKNFQSYAEALKGMGFGQPTQDELDLQAQNKQAYAQAQQSQNLAPWLGLIQGAGEGLQNTSPFASVGLGKLISGSAKGVSEQQKQAEDQLAKIRAGELDLNKLNSTDRNNLLHYAMSGSTAEQVAKDAAASRIEAQKLRLTQLGSAAADRTFNARLGAYNNAFNKIVGSMQDKMLGKPLTEEQLTEARRIANATADDFIAKLTGGKGNASGNKGGNTGGDDPLNIRG